MKIYTNKPKTWRIQNGDAISLLLAVQLKEVCNENQGGGKLTYVRHRYRIVAIDVLLSFNFAVVFILMYFRFLMNRQNAAARLIFFFSFITRTAY
jgi:hypothetical protein